MLTFFYIENKQSYNYLRNMHSFCTTRYNNKFVGIVFRKVSVLKNVNATGVLGRNVILFKELFVYYMDGNYRN